MMSGVRASSMKMLSASSTRAKWCGALHVGVLRRVRWPLPCSQAAQNGESCPLVPDDLEPVAQEIEAELRGGAVGDVAAIGGCAVLLGHLQLQDADASGRGLVDRPDPLGVAAGQVIVDRGDVDALAGQGVEEGRQRGEQRLAFAGGQLGQSRPGA